MSRFHFGQQSLPQALTDFGGNRQFYPNVSINNHKFVVIFCYFYSLNADLRQGNAYNNSNKKVSINYKRITCNLMPYCRQNDVLHVEYLQVNFLRARTRNLAEML